MMKRSPSPNPNRKRCPAPPSPRPPTPLKPPQASPMRNMSPARRRPSSHRSPSPCRTDSSHSRRLSPISNNVTPARDRRGDNNSKDGKQKPESPGYLIFNKQRNAQGMFTMQPTVAGLRRPPAPRGAPWGNYHYESSSDSDISMLFDENDDMVVTPTAISLASTALGSSLNMDDSKSDYSSSRPSTPTSMPEMQLKYSTSGTSSQDGSSSPNLNYLSTFSDTSGASKSENSGMTPPPPSLNRMTIMANEETPPISNVRPQQREIGVGPPTAPIRMASPNNNTIQSMTPRSKSIIDWWVPRPNHANPSPMSLPSMLGAPSSEVSDLESPNLLLESYFQSGIPAITTASTSAETVTEEESDIHSQSLRDEESEIISTGMMTMSQKTSVSPYGSWQQQQLDPPAYSSRVPVKKFDSRNPPKPLLGDEKEHRQQQSMHLDSSHQLFFGPSAATPSPRNQEAFEMLKDEQKSRPSITELPSHEEKAEEAGKNSKEEKNDDDKSSLASTLGPCCRNFKRIALVVLILLVIIIIAITLIGNSKSRGRSADPIPPVEDDETNNTSSDLGDITSSPTISKTQSPTMIEESVPTFAPIPEIRPTTPNGAPIGRPSQTTTLPIAAPTITPSSQSISSPTSSPTTVPAVSGTEFPTPNMEEFPDEAFWDIVLIGDDIWDDASLNTIPTWVVNDSGLRLEILSALDNHYDVYLKNSVEDWQQSQALDLTITQVSSDIICKPKFGRIKLCNGDYGETDWRGMSMLFIEDDNIVSATVRMNDHYILDDISIGDISYEQHNFCHQLGHMFGLPHSNASNCMAIAQYSSSNSVPTELQHPDQANLDNLVEMYGAIPNLRRNAETATDESRNVIGIAMNERLRVAVLKF